MSQAPVTRVGNVTNTPELRITPSGKAVCNFDLAFEPYDFETKKRGETIFYRCTAWEKLAENVNDTLERGMRVIVQGLPKTEEYTSKDGEKRTQKIITVLAVGPEIRFATATVTKNARANASASSDPWTADDNAF